MRIFNLGIVAITCALVIMVMAALVVTIAEAFA